LPAEVLIKMSGGDGLRG